MDRHEEWLKQNYLSVWTTSKDKTISGSKQSFYDAIFSDSHLRALLEGVRLEYVFTELNNEPFHRCTDKNPIELYPGDIVYSNPVTFFNVFSLARETESIPNPDGLVCGPAIANDWFDVDASIRLLANYLLENQQEIASFFASEIRDYRNFEHDRDRHKFVGFAICFWTGCIRHVVLSGYCPPVRYLIEIAKSCDKPDHYLTKRCAALDSISENKCADIIIGALYPKETTPAASPESCISIICGCSILPRPRYQKHISLANYADTIMFRNFLTVGQGAFYCERFVDGRAVIYDCGSSSPGIACITEIIDDEFDEKDWVDLVFISHFDNDHVNGLGHLLKRCRVRFLVFPLLHEHERILLLSTLKPEPGSFLDRLIKNPWEAIKEDSSFQGIRVVGLEKQPLDDDATEEYFEERQNELSDKIEQGNNNPTMQSGTILTLPSADGYWGYLPFNFEHPERQKALIRELAGNLVVRNGLIEADQIEDDEDISDLKKAYKQVKGSLNSNSMTVLSYPINDNYYCQIASRETLEKREALSSDSMRNPLPRNPSCLYLGDYEASRQENWNAVKSAYGDMLDSVGCLQLPHHGSGNSYNEEFATSNAFLVASAGKRNQYHHPNWRVLHHLALLRRVLFLVTEDADSKTVFDVVACPLLDDTNYGVETDNDPI